MPGFIPFARGSFMMDFVVVAMFAILPILSWSIYLVKVKRNYELHRKVQAVLGFTLLITVSLFEVDVRVNGWRHLALPSPYYYSILFPFLGIHLFFAISTSLLWTVTLWSAWKQFPYPTGPGPYSMKHKKLAWLATGGMFMTSITGWTFYYLAFIA